MGYRETAPPAALRSLVETVWTADGGDDPVRVLPDGCMDLIAMDGRVVVAGPDITATVATRGQQAVTGMRFRPGTLPRLLGVPAAHLVGRRVPLADLRPVRHRDDLLAITGELSNDAPRGETAPWSLATLHHVTTAFADGASVGHVARDIGWSSRTLQRHCQAVYGYGPTTLRRVLRFRRAVSLLQADRAPADVAATTGYADQPHLHREVRALSGTTAGAIRAASTR